MKSGPTGRASRAGGLPDEAKWRDLADRAPGSNPFFAPTILTAAMATLAPRAVRVVTAHGAGGKLVALAPVVTTRLGRLAPALSVWTHLYGPLGAPLLDGLDPEAAAAALIVAIEGERSGRALLAFPDLPLDGVAGSALLAVAKKAGRPIALLKEERRAVLRGDGAGGVRDALPAKQRKELGRQLRRLGDLGAVTFDRADGGEDRAAFLASFLALEASGWKGARGTALAKQADALAFIRAVAATAAPHEMEIDRLAVDGRPVAMLVTFRSGGTAVTWKIAHDEALARFSPGVQVMLAASERLVADPAIGLVDSLASADHPMVDRLWPERQAMATLVLGPLGGGPLFRAGLLLAEAEEKARQHLRALIRR